MATLGLDEPAWLVETLVALVHATLGIAVSFTRNAKESKPDVRRLDDTRRLRRMEFGGASVLAVCAGSCRKPRVARPGRWGRVHRPDHAQADPGPAAERNTEPGGGGGSLGTPDVSRPGLGCAARLRATPTV
jgi:hypothetical protein